jgi:hypothetical protein
MDCLSCFQPFTPNLDTDLCDGCINEAYSHQPRKYVRITLQGFGTYIQPLESLATALDGEMDGAEFGTKWTLELIEMSAAEYAKLPEFTGH